MADNGNPFGPLPADPGAQGGAGYPFDAMPQQGPVGGEQLSFGLQPSPFGGAGPSSHPPPPPSASEYPFGAPMSPPAPAPAPAPVSYGQSYSPYSQPQPQANHFSPSGYSMVSAAASEPPAPMINPFQPQSQPVDSIVISPYQSNPYAGVIASQHQHQQQPQGTFDPFAAPPRPPASVQQPAFPTTELVPAPAAPQYGQLQPYGQPAFMPQDPFGAAATALPPSQPEDDDPLAAFGGTPSVATKKAQAQQPNQAEEKSPARTRADQRGSSPDRRPVDLDDQQPTHLGPPQYHYGQRSPDSSNPAPNEATISPQVRNPYREELARRAPPGSSPLPKADLVRKRGYVLSRISFRTIVMKKWKQTYWVQYGPHTMIWFRSEADFTDWLNNPYHDQAQRNFLIKLAVNFVHDLYKPNVRGYQVTQCRTKAYGNKMVRQFKLERWMDYGPTIAAAFGSYDPREVDTLREAIVECMRNTPLNSGIRATGAVRQRPSQSQDSEDASYARNTTRSSRDDESEDSERRYESRNGQRSGDRPTEAQNGKAGDSVAEESDLLDVDNWDDVPGQAMGASSVDVHQQAQLVPYQHQQPQQPYPPPPPPQQQPGYSGAAYGVPPVASPLYPQQHAIVPASGGPQAYPGAPPPPQHGLTAQPSQMQQPPPPPAAPQPAFAAVQDPWGPPPAQPQPTHPPGAPPSQFPPYAPPQQQVYGQPPPQQYPQQAPPYPYQQQQPGF